jgi:hypothetical protein
MRVIHERDDQRQKKFLVCSHSNDLQSFRLKADAIEKGKNQNTSEKETNCINKM